MTTSTVERARPRPRRRPRRGAAVLVTALLVLLAAGWWWGRGPQAWWTARSFVQALERGDCADAARYYSGERAGVGCSPSAYWLPDDLTGYRLHGDRVGRGPDDDQAAVAVTVPGDDAAYSLHLVRRGIGWVIDGVAVSA